MIYNAQFADTTIMIPALFSSVLTCFYCIDNKNTLRKQFDLVTYMFFPLGLHYDYDSMIPKREFFSNYYSNRSLVRTHCTPHIGNIYIYNYYEVPFDSNRPYIIQTLLK